MRIAQYIVLFDDFFKKYLLKILRIAIFMHKLFFTLTSNLGQFFKRKIVKFSIIVIKC